MATKNKTLKTYQTYRSIFKGRLFEFILAKLLTKAGFTGDFASDQLSKNKKKLHGRGGTYAPDFYGVFNIGIPFINPLLLIVEAKYFTKRVGIKIAREFLGAYIDFSQYIKIDTKSRKLEKKYEKLYETRYTYCPVFFSIKGYEKPAQAFMYAHGINYISYSNSKTIETILNSSELILKEINFAKFTDEDIKNFTSLDSLTQLRKAVKKDGFDTAFKKFSRIFDLLNSYVAVIDQRFPINILHKGRIRKNWFKNVNIKHELDGKFTFRTSADKIVGEFSLPKYFLKEYIGYAQHKNLADKVFKEIHIIIPIENDFEIKSMKISEESRVQMIESIANIEGTDEDENSEKQK